MRRNGSRTSPTTGPPVRRPPDNGATCPSEAPTTWTTPPLVIRQRQTVIARFRIVARIFPPMGDPPPRKERLCAQARIICEHYGNVYSSSSWSSLQSFAGLPPPLHPQYSYRLCSIFTCGSGLRRMYFSSLVYFFVTIIIS